MGYAVLLYFDEQTEWHILELRQTLIEASIPSLMNKMGDRPHISLAGFSGVEGDSLISVVQEFANGRHPFSIQLSAIGLFPTKENVLFLSPVPTIQLLTCHQEFHQRLAKSKLVSSPYYAPESWVPHCTVEMNIPDEQLQRAIEYCIKAFTPIVGQFQEMGVIEYWPIKPLETWRFHANSENA
jgi:2'-5' RNA ligase